jgi:predicted Zn-dependent protease
MAFIVSISFGQTAKSDQALITEAREQYAAGKLADAEQSFNAIAKRHPSNVAAQMYLGQTLFREEKYKEAAITYERVQVLEKAGIKLDRVQHRILVDQLAMAYGLSGRSTDAKALLQESARTDPTYPLNYYNLACISADEGDKAGVLKNLSLAFRHKDQVLPGEQMPDPTSDPSFKKYADDSDFKELLGRIKLQS